MEPNEGHVELDLVIRQPPEAVRAWWTEFPDDYEAKDPNEQPVHIRTLDRQGNERRLLTTWRNPDGSSMKLEEVMRVRPDGTWTFDIANAFGVRIHDEFRAEPDPEGTRLHIESTLTPSSPESVDAMQAIEAQMRKEWPEAARICERDAGRELR